jgi:hypothetical protein
MVVISDKAGFNGGGGGGLAAPKGVDFARNIPLGLAMPPPNLAKASCMDDSRVFDPKVGVPHLELARSMISMSPRRFFSLCAAVGVSYSEPFSRHFIPTDPVPICPSNESTLKVFSG